MAATPVDSCGRGKPFDGASDADARPPRGGGGHRRRRVAIGAWLCCALACRAIASYERAPAPVEDGGGGGATGGGASVAAAAGASEEAPGAEPLDAATASHEHGDALEPSPADGGLRPPPPNPECAAYCDTVQQECTGLSLVYVPNSTECEDLCPHFVSTGPDEGANTLPCRINQATQAMGTTEKASYCDAASRMGESGRRDVCGSACEAYCQLMSSVCPGRVANDTCEAECEALVDRGNFHAGTCEEGGDADDGASVQCRMWHVGAAAIALQASNAPQHTLHCEHAAGLRAPCIGERNTAERCLPRVIAPLPEAP